MAVALRGGVVAGFLFLLILTECKARIHKLTLKNETRVLVPLNSFGFYPNGTLDVNLLALRLFEQDSVNHSDFPVGFSLSRSRVSGVLSYTAEQPATCPLKSKTSPNNEPLIIFLIDVKRLQVNVTVVGEQDNILTAKRKVLPPDQRKRRDVPPEGGAPLQPVNNAEHASSQDKNEGDSGNQKKDSQTDQKAIPAEDETPFDLNKTKSFVLALNRMENSYNFSFHLKVGLVAQGLYNLNFHYCQNLATRNMLPYSFAVEVTEKNPGGCYLSAAEIPLSRLYIGMAGVFFTAALVWVYTLMKHRYSVFKIHWLMAALAFTKSTSLVFHSINYHFINTEGHPIEGWAVMYYITHLLKGALLFITLALIGTGWAFVKYILSDKEKKIFMIVIPLQVLANVAYIIIESTEEGSSEYSMWKQILFLVDLICCGAILFPVVWSIRHLQEASSTDGKAAMNLEKLKLFRHYYVMIVCYIYFTRIIAILLKITMPFQWQWCYEFLVEVSTLIFFVLTGYNFRPASNNPYLQLPQDEEDVEMDEVVTESGALEGISKVKKTSNGRDRQKESTL
ncbi:protein GPR108 isoform X1 [Sphaeramia orbicularis]|uniref:protein GPR108 isoform X1 n=1 Tax=Sphaeramia orbicularis TaxID=375764 RepID=UPI00117E197D|nr:protein GPR108 isoform X1 [Sphaeramia orbicularis]